MEVNSSDLKILGTIKTFHAIIKDAIRTFINTKDVDLSALESHIALLETLKGSVLSPVLLEALKAFQQDFDELGRLVTQHAQTLQEEVKNLAIQKQGVMKYVKNNYRV